MASGALTPFDLPEWVEEHKEDFRPPVCNKCLYNSQLTIFLVGGPNMRKDFHLEEGEEFFFQMKGDMLLRIVENGDFKDVVIREGQVFLLPSRMLHSPQRYENTMGLVVERRRGKWEFDSLRYHVEGTTDILFERWLNLKDIVRDLPPIIKEYFESEAHRTGKPTTDSVIPNRPYDPDPSATTEAPLSLLVWIENQKQSLKLGKPIQLYGPPFYKTTVVVYGPGVYEVGSLESETFIYQIEGSTKVCTDDGVGGLNISLLKYKNTLLIASGKKAKMSVELETGYVLTVCMDPPSAAK